jgi:hypothetical protein
MRGRLKKVPNPGDLREKLGFAWLPIYSLSGEWVWFEDYIAIEVYCRLIYEDYPAWHVKEFISLSDYIEEAQNDH